MKRYSLMCGLLAVCALLGACSKGDKDALAPPADTHTESANGSIVSDTAYAVGATTATKDKETDEPKELAYNKETGKKPGTALPDETGKPPATDGKVPQKDVPTEDNTVQRMIVRNGSVGLMVENLDSTEKKLTVVVQTAGGYVSTSQRDASSGTARTGSTVIRVPSVNFDKLVDAVRGLGTVKNEQITADEVTQEYIDGTARRKSLQELDEQLSMLLKTRRGSLQEIIEIQDKRTEVRTQIESIEGRLRYLRNQTAYSTLRVNMSEPGAMMPNQPYTAGGRLGNSITKGLDGAMQVLEGFITVLITLLPLILLGLIAWLVMRPWMRRRKAEREAARAARQKTTAAQEVPAKPAPAGAKPDGA